ncbi:sugar ABC transporter substrate-binding protein [Ruania halotolerans]|uniref:sugar ABC transporter substrate-binding protein n=1 Tax=Ruania halotolerans TaxID=2897773 RepID=UPI001E55D2FE|nr:sugar ABC transporter substrate-binding protein [Ruania halotolerans]UFU05433.1 sugar ABC transporter substrate-binding protein [Ruania halotolerans]
MSPRSPRSRLAAAAAVLTSGALALAACSDESPTPSADEATPSAINLLGPEDPATFAPLIEGFEAEHDGYSVEYTQVPFDQLNSTLQQRLGAEDSTIDVYTVDQPRVAQLAAQGYLVDLTDLADEAQEVMSPTMYDVNVIGEEMWAASIWDSTQLMFYNVDALTAAGVEPPSSDPAERWTWEETVAAAEQVQAAGETEWGLILEQIEYYYQLQPLMASLGGGSGITGEDALTPDITNDAWVEAMTWYGDLFADGLAPRGVGSFETSPIFADGESAFFVGGPWDVGVFSESETNWAVAPMPYFDGGEQVTPTGSWSWGINPASQNQAAALLFLEYATLNPEGNLLSTEATTIIPANAEAAAEYLPQLEELAGDRSAGVADLITYELENTAFARPLTVGYVQFEEVMNTAFADIRNGSDPAERLAEATSQLEDAWSQLR